MRTTGGTFFALLLMLVAVAFMSSPEEIQAQTREFAGFRGACAYVETKVADPIAKTDHLHDFFGAKGITNETTYAGLRRSETTCLRNSEANDDKSGYWSPAIKVVHPDGSSEIHTPDWSGFYFQSLRGLDPRKTKAFPRGFRMIARESAPKQGRIDWHCNVTQTGRQLTPRPPASCTEQDDGLGLRITFPECWDGQARNPETGAHNVTEAIRKRDGSRKRVCPNSHPVQLPTLTMWPDYPGFQLQEGDTVEVSIGHEEWGSHSSMHADFFMGFNLTKMRTLVRECIREPAIDGGRRPSICDAGTIPNRG